MINIKTKFFGEIDIDEEQIIFFPFGLFGFEEYNRFILLHDKDDEESIFRWLQCLDDETLCFTVMEPDFICEDYSPKLPENILVKIGVNNINGANSSNNSEDLIYLIIAVIYEEITKSTANLLGPVVINSKNRMAMQVILESGEAQNSSYKTKHRLFDGKTDSTQKEGSVVECS